MRIKTKRWLIGTALSTVVLALFSLGIYAVSKPRPYIGYVVQGEGVNSLNYAREESGASIYTGVVEGLLTLAPRGALDDQSDNLRTVLDVPRISMIASRPDPATFDGMANTPNSIWGFRDEDLYTWGQANFGSFSDDDNAVDGGLPTLAGKWKFRLRADARWANGHRVAAEDFVQTIKYIVDLRNGSTLIRQFRDAVPLRGAQALIEEQEQFYRANGRYREDLRDYTHYATLFGVNGGVYALSNPLEPSSVFYAFPGALTPSSSYLYYQMEPGIVSPSFYTLLGKPLFLPISKAFVDSIGGFENFGHSVETIMANGPFQLVSYDPDYTAIFERRDDYWDRARVLTARWERRVITSNNTKVYLFIQNKLAEVEVAADYVRIFQESARLKKLLLKGGSTNTTFMLKFNLANDPVTGARAAHFDVANNVHFRRALSLAINRKLVLNLNALGVTTPAGDVFAPSLTSFFDANNNNFHDYLSRTRYKLHGVDLGTMTQYDQKQLDKFRSAFYVEDIAEDKYQNLDLARREFATFLAANPQYENQPVVVRVLYESSYQYALLGIAQQITEAFNGKVVFDLKPLPVTSFRELTRQNKDYDVVLDRVNPDTQTDAWTVLRLLAAPAPAGTEIPATINTTGAWTYLQGLEWLMQNEPTRLAADLGITPAEVEALWLLLTEIHHSPRAALFGGVLSGRGWTNAQKMAFYVKLEKIIRDQAPVIVLYHSFSGYYGRRLMGATSIAGWSLLYKYAYNADEVPQDTPWSLPSLR